MPTQPKRIIVNRPAQLGNYRSIYRTTALHSSRDFLLTALVTAQALSFFTIPVGGYLSDPIGHKRMYIFGSVATAVFGFIYFRTAEHCCTLLDVARDRAVLRFE